MKRVRNNYTLSGDLGFRIRGRATKRAAVSGDWGVPVALWKGVDRSEGMDAA